MRKVVELARRRGKDRQFETLMEAHFKALYAAARRLTGTPADAEDLVQEVCIKAYRHRRDLGRMEYPRAWLLRTLYNRFVDDRRRHQRAPDGSTAEDAGGVDLAGPETLEPERQAERMYNAEAIQAAMLRLGSEACGLLMMHDVDGLSLREIETATGLPNGTIKSRLHRARVRLGRLLTRDEGTGMRRARGGDGS